MHCPSPTPFFDERRKFSHFLSKIMNYFLEKQLKLDEVRFLSTSKLATDEN